MKLEIDINERELQFLKQYAELYDSERKIDITSTPIVVVEERDYIVSDEDYNAGDYVYVVDDEMTFYSSEELRGFLKEITDEAIDKADMEGYVMEQYLIRKFPVSYFWKPVAYFLTRKEAKDYCRYQKHNLSNRTRIYSRGIGYGNQGDLECLMVLLRKIGTKLVEEQQ